MIEQVQVENVEVNKIPKVIKDLTSFAEMSISDTTDIINIVSFKEVDSSGVLQTVDIERAASRFKQMMTNKKGYSYPIIEIADTDNVVFMVQGRGYGGPIWAKILFDKNEIQIKKLEFQHSAESEGYGAAITQSYFENQFTDKKLSSNGDAFGLEQNGQTILEGLHIVDGTSGATQTSRAAVDMINEGLERCMDHLVQ